MRDAHLLFPYNPKKKHPGVASVHCTTVLLVWPRDGLIFRVLDWINSTIVTCYRLDST